MNVTKFVYSSAIQLQHVDRLPIDFVKSIGHNNKIHYSQGYIGDKGGFMPYT
jgi:hypothetical protein